MNTDNHVNEKGNEGYVVLVPRCVEGLQVGAFKRMLYCSKCRHEMDRDAVTATNIAYKGRSRFERSQGAVGEAMRGNLRCR